MTLAQAGRREDALRELDRMSETFPERPEIHVWRAQTCGLLGMTEKAVTELEQLRAKTKALRESGAKGWTAGVPPTLLVLDMFSYAAVGRTERIREMIAEAEAASRVEHVSSSTVGFLYLVAGEKEKAFELLEKSIEERDAGVFMYSCLYLPLMKQARQLYDSVVSDQRFASLLQRAGVHPSR
jgi:tetratricopeptide (TPR) repeat protein